MILGLGAPAGKAHLSGMAAQLRGALREEHRQLGVRDDRHQHRRRRDRRGLAVRVVVAVDREGRRRAALQSFAQRRDVDQGMSTTEPVVWRPSRSRCACAASARRYFFVVSIFTLPDFTTSAHGSVLMLVT